MDLLLVQTGLGPVEDDHLAALELVHHELAHIGVVGEEGVGVGKADLLVDDPVLGHILVEIVQQPHPVVFHHAALHIVGHLELGQMVGVELGGVLQDLDEDIFPGELVGGIFLHPLLAEEEEGPLPGVEALVLQGLLDEAGLPGLEKAGEQVNRDLHISLPGRAPPEHARRSWSR